MKKEKILKMIVVLVTGVILFTMSTNVFALSDSDSSVLDGYYEDKTNQLNTNKIDLSANTNNNTNTNTNTNTNINTNTNTNVSNNNTNNYNTNLPQAGAPESTMMGVAITVLAITAIYAYKKVREYKKI